MDGQLFIVSAPSGAGKTTLVAATLENLKKEWPIERVVTYTTKKPRSNEMPGQDYHFLETDDFERRIADGFFLEWSNAYGTYYGSPRSIVDGMAKGRSYIAIVDRVGAGQIKAVVSGAILIWIKVPSFEELSRRLRSRGTESDEQVEKRLARAKIEIRLEGENSFYDHVIINDDFLQAQRQLEALVREVLRGF